MTGLNAASFANQQRIFAEAIFSDPRSAPGTIAGSSSVAAISRFGVYRNNVMSSLINAIGAKYPVTRKLLWEDAFHEVARRYIAAEPPRSPVLFEYGDSFPRFLRQIGQCCGANYLADIAALEAARTHAYHAADARPIGKDAFAAIPPEQFGNLPLKLHPSTVLLKSRFPIVSIWESNHFDGTNSVSQWMQEAALVARPDHDVQVWRLTDGEYEFFAALSERKTVAAAIEHAMTMASHFEPAEALATLVAVNVVIEFETPDATPDD
jgi:hypothetical protein